MMTLQHNNVALSLYYVVKHFFHAPPVPAAWQTPAAVRNKIATNRRFILPL
jgi:hypothetical protein